MPGLRGLTLAVISADPARYRAALEFALAQAALGGSARIHLHGEAAAMLGDADDELTRLHGEAVALGVRTTACQSGLGDRSMPAGVEPDGPVGLLSGLGDDRLLIF